MNSTTVKLEKFVPGGQAMGTLPDGRKVFVWGGLPGETVEVEITKSKKSYAEAIAMTVIEKSPHRVEPLDGCYLSTSPWQTMDYEYELEQKAELAAEAFQQEGIGLRGDRFGTIRSYDEDLTTSPVTTGARSVSRNDYPQTDSRQYFYRNKMEYSLYWDNDDNLIKLAFHKRGSHQKIPATQSSIERPEIFAEAKRIIDGLNARGEQARKYQSLLVRCNQNGEVSSALFENGKPHPVMKNLTDNLLGRKYSYSPNGFFQINLPAYEMALREIANCIDSEKVIDMYAGVGTIGLSVATDRDLILVETNASAFQELERNIPVGATNIQAVCSKSEDALDYIASDATVIVDPPRAGLDQKLIDKLSEVQPRKIIYLSCNPTTQARDVAKLTACGHPGPDPGFNKMPYKITKDVAFNFFPRTPHIEHLVVLEAK
ncbi:23S rRNA (uracil-5-)-methyltransferase RumA [Alphaproteobacteria bacterium]|nr:23S rRNA (uracil-5-)-methyltransferase RumA [Alphaproteobacteria bacterium]